MAKVQREPHRPVYPTPAGLITSVDEDGEPNIITLGEVHNLSISKPVIVGLGIAPARHSHELISRTKEFVVNLPTASLVEKVDRCGSVSGRKVDKFEFLGLTPLPATKVRPPLIAECPVNLECVLLGVEPIGDHDLFRGEVVVQHVDEELLDENGGIVTERLDAFAYVLGDYWTLGRKIGSHGMSVRR